MPRALVGGSSSGIGLATARALVDAGWDVAGVARRPAPLEHARYTHAIGDVRDPDIARALPDGALDLCVYCAGVGRLLDVATCAGEADAIAVNFVGAARVVEHVIPPMIAARRGHLIGVSSQADRLIDRHAPSYAASKAGLSAYLEGLALACRPHGVAVTNLRLGFVDTAMSRDAGGPRPFVVPPERIAALVLRCVARRPIRVTFPRRLAPLVWLANLGARWRVRWG